MRLAVLVLLLLMSGVTLAEALFATVAGEVISRAEYEAHVEAGLRQKFFHGKVPDDQLRVFREEMAQELIDRVLLVQEARRRDLQVQAAHVEAVMEQTRQRYRHNPAWQQQGKTMLAQLRRGVERRDLIAQLRQAVSEDVNRGGEPDVAAVRAYYRAHANKFTTPERLRLSLIMLAVEPWAPQAKWQAAQQEALRLLTRLRAGSADFADLARLHSSDASAAAGGDLGYMHLGMLAMEAQQHVEELQVGAIAEPLRLLQGIALFRLDGREAAQLNSFDSVQERARGLLQRQQQQEGWLQLLKGLRLAAPVQRYEIKMNNDG